MTTRNTRSALRLLATVIGATAILATVAFADTPATPTPAPAPAPAVTSYHGTVTTVTPDTAGGGTITIQKGKQDPQTFTVTTSTKITVDKQTSTLDKVPVGDIASIKSADGKTADSIHAHAKKTTPPPTAPSTTPAPTTPAPTN